jgi:hypothetical protein
MEVRDKVLVCAAMLIVLASIAAFVGSSPMAGISGKSVYETPYGYMYTKAVCDESRYCEDYQIFCEDESLVRMVATGMAVQMPAHWEDPRDRETIENFC